MVLVCVLIHPASKEEYRIEQDASEEDFYTAVASVIRDFQRKNKHYIEIAVYEAYTGKDDIEKLW